MRDCSQVPAAAWQLLATARWEQLRKADFTLRLGEGAAVLKGGGDPFYQRRLRLGQRIWVPRPPLFCQRPVCCYRSAAEAIEVLRQ